MREWRAAGMGWLHEPVCRHGGPLRWAGEFGVHGHFKPRDGEPSWTPQRIERELRIFFATEDISEWPKKDVFIRAGRSALMRAVYNDAGTEAWAERIGVPNPCALPRRSIASV